MIDASVKDDDMPAEIDFSNGVRGLHYIPTDAQVLMPASIERSVREHFARKAEREGIALSELLIATLKRAMEISEDRES